MPSRVTLKVVHGALQGQEYVYEERATCIIGRSSDCQLRIPKDEEHQTISRHHCLLDINPPDIRVRDFGSLNGTYVNGKKIGQRKRQLSAEQAAQVAYPELDLHDGDEVRLLQTVFRVLVYVPKLCNQCDAEISEAERRASLTADGQYICPRCRTGGRSTPSAASSGVVCAACGQDSTAEAGTERRGEYVCGACRAVPDALLNRVLTLAMQGDPRAAALQGLQVTQRLSQYPLGAEYLAHYPSTGAAYHVKLMLPQVVVEPHARSRFLNEVENIKALDHPALLRVVGSGHAQGIFFTVNEAYDGEQADQRMARLGGKMPVNDAVAIVLSALDGLSYAHTATVPHSSLSAGVGVLHRDLSPHSLVIVRGQKPQVKIVDFGLAKAFDAAGLSGQTATGLLAGKPFYMPRQQVLNFLYNQPDVDVWALAATLYHLLTGHFVPRDFPNDQDPWQVVLNTQAIAIRQRDASIPARLAEVIDTVLVDKPTMRVKSAVDFKRLLQAALSGT